MIKITKPTLQKALIAGFFSAFTIGVLTVLTYKSTLGYFLAGSFGSSGWFNFMHASSDINKSRISSKFLI